MRSYKSQHFSKSTLFALSKSVWILTGYYPVCSSYCCFFVEIHQRTSPMSSIEVLRAHSWQISFSELLISVTARVAKILKHPLKNLGTPFTNWDCRYLLNIQLCHNQTKSASLVKQMPLMVLQHREWASKQHIFSCHYQGICLCLKEGLDAFLRPKYRYLEKIIYTMHERIMKLRKENEDTKTLRKSGGTRSAQKTKFYITYTYHLSLHTKYCCGFY